MSLWSLKSIKSRYVIRNRKKYVGDPSKVIARSTWERAAFIWCESNPSVLKWSSETLAIPYICATDKKPHKYIMDLLIWWRDGSISIIEIKPKSQVERPIWPGRKTKKYMTEALMYVKNQSKWKAAKQFAEKKGYRFEIWTQDVMKNKGIKII